jgi:hypothetical protein
MDELEIINIGDVRILEGDCVSKASSPTTMCCATLEFSLLSDAFKLRDFRGCVFATTVSQIIIKVKESFGDGFVKKSFSFFFSSLS